MFFRTDRHSSAIADKAGDILVDDKKLFERIAVDEKKFTTSPSFAVAPILDPPIRNGLRHCLQALLHLIYNDGPETAPSDN